MKEINMDKMIGYIASRFVTRANVSLEDKEIIIEEILKLEEDYLNEHGLIENNITETGFVEMEQVAEPIITKKEMLFHITANGVEDVGAIAKELVKQLKELIK